MCDEHFDLSPDTIKIADDLKANEKVDESITGSILAVDVNRSYTCINSNGRIEDVPDNAVLECSNCRFRVKKDGILCNTVANMVLREENGETVGRFYCPYAVLNSLFSTLSTTQGFNIDETDIAKLSTDMMEETLLNLDTSFQVLMDKKLIKSVGLH